MTAEDIYNLMKEVQAQLGILLQRDDFVTDEELAKYTKALKTQQAPVFDSAKVAQYLLPALLAQLPKQAPLQLVISDKKVAELLSAEINQQVTAIQASNRNVLQVMAQQTVSMEATCGKIMSEADALVEDVGALVKSVPARSAANTWRERFISAGVGAVATLALTGATYGICFKGFSRVSRADYELVQVDYKASQRHLSNMRGYRENLLKDYPQLAYKYFPYFGDPKPTPPAIPKPTRAKSLKYVKKRK